MSATRWLKKPTLHRSASNSSKKRRYMQINSDRKPAKAQLLSQVNCNICVKLSSMIKRDWYQQRGGKKFPKRKSSCRSKWGLEITKNKKVMTYKMVLECTRFSTNKVLSFPMESIGTKTSLLTAFAQRRCYCSQSWESDHSKSMFFSKVPASPNATYI